MYTSQVVIYLHDTFFDGNRCTVSQMAKKTRQTRCADQCLLAQGGEKHNQDSGADLVPKSKLSQNEHRSRQITRHSRTCWGAALFSAASHGRGSRLLPGPQRPHRPRGHPDPTAPQRQGQPEAATFPGPERGVDPIELQPCVCLSDDVVLVLQTCRDPGHPTGRLMTPLLTEVV